MQELEEQFFASVCWFGLDIPASQIEAKYFDQKYHLLLEVVLSELSAGNKLSKTWFQNNHGIFIPDEAPPSVGMSLRLLMDAYNFEIIKAMALRLGGVFQSNAPFKSEKGQEILIETLDKLKLSSSAIMLSKKVYRIEDIDLAPKKIDKGKSVLTPFPTLNRAMRGFYPSEVITIAARPGVGKTWLGLRFCQEFDRQKKRTLIITPEMSSEVIKNRAIALETKIPYWRFRAGEFSEDQINTINAITRCNAETSDLWVGVGDFDLKFESVEYLVMKLKPEVLFIDSIYLLKTNNDSFKDKFSRIGDVFEKVKNLAKRMNLIVICTSQLNRDPASGTNKKGKVSGERIAFSDAIVHSSDYIFSVDETGENELSMYAVKTRDSGKFDKLTIDFDLGCMHIEETSAPFVSNSNDVGFIPDDF